MDKPVSDIVRRVARALAAKRYSHCGGADLEVLVAGKANWEFCVEDAETAILAMREPTTGMIAAGSGGGDWPWSRNTWIDMIDEALADRYLDLGGANG